MGVEHDWHVVRAEGGGLQASVTLDGVEVERYPKVYKSWVWCATRAIGIARWRTKWAKSRLADREAFADLLANAARLGVMEDYHMGPHPAFDGSKPAHAIYDLAYELAEKLRRLG